ncbi:MAG: hypothetical protein V5A88_04465 [Candidatus Thermoplasmatota archaeon]
MMKQMDSRWVCILAVIILVMSSVLPLVGSAHDMGGETSKSQSVVKPEYIGNDNERLRGHQHQYLDYDVQVDAPSQREGNYGETLTYIFEVLNNGTKTDSYDWEAESGHGWLTSNTEGTIEDVPSNETAEVFLTVQIPENTDPYTADRLLLEVTSQTDPAVSDKGVTYTYTEARYGSNIEPTIERIERTPGSEFTITYNLKNVGNIIDSYELIPYVDNPYWEISSRESTEMLEPSESTQVDVEVSIPEVGMDYNLDEKDIYYGARKSIVLNAQAGNGVINTTSPVPSVNVGPYFSASLRPLGNSKSIDYSETTTDIEFDLEVRNLCNVRDEEESKMDIEVSEKNKTFETDVNTDEEDEAKRWAVSVSAPNVTLVGGETDEIRTRITAPRAPLNGTFLAQFVARPYPYSDVSEEFIHNGTGEISVIVNQTGDVLVSPVDEEVAGSPEEKVRLNFTVKNIGNGIDQYELLSTTESRWKSEIVEVEGEETGMVGNLHPSQKANVTVEVEIPRMTELGHVEEVTLTSISVFEKYHHNETISDSGSAFVTVGEGYSVILEPDMNSTTVSPEETVSFTINVTNAGNVRDTITLSLEHPDTNRWETELKRTSLTIDRWNTTSTHLNVTPTTDAIHEEPFNVTVIGRSQGNRSEYDTANATAQVVQVPDVNIELVEPELSIKPGETLDINISISNEGNTNDSFRLGAEAGNEHWDVGVEEELIGLAPLESAYLLVNVTAPDIPDEPTPEKLEELEILGGTIFEVIFNATSQTDETMNDSIEAELTVEKVRRHRIVSMETKDALPGKSAEHEIEVFNLGNADDTVNLNITSEEDEDYVYHAHFDENTLPLAIGEKTVANLTVQVPVELEPYLGQEIELSVGNEDFSEETTTITRVVMINSEEPYRNIKIGETAEYDVTIVNVPLEAEDQGPGDTLQDVVNLSAPIEELESEGWDVTFIHRGTEFDITAEDFEFEEAYESEDLLVRLDAPRIEREDVLTLEITAHSQDRDLPDGTNVLDLETGMSWFDLRPVEINIEPRKNGRELEIIFTIERSGSEELFPEGGEENPPIPFELRVENELIDQEEIEFLDSEERGLNEETFRYKVTYDLNEWRWGESVREYDVEVIVDPDDEIYMINAAGDADQNNEMEEELVVSRYNGIPYWLPLLLFVISLLVFAFSWAALDRNNKLCVLMGVSLGIMFGSMVMFPWQWLIDSFETINYLTMGIMIAGMVSFAAFLFLIRFEIRDLLRSLTYHIIEKNPQDRNIRGKMEEQEAEDEEVKETGWVTEEESMDEEAEDKKTPSPYYYHIALSLTGAFTYLTFLLVTNLDFVFMKDPVGIVTSGFLNVSYLVLIPNIIFVVVYAVIGFVVAVSVRKLYEKLWKRISSNERIIMDLKEKAERIIGEGEKSVSN